MEIFDRRCVKEAARLSISRASYDPRMLVLIHSGCILLLGLITVILNAFLVGGMDAAGGLGGMGQRAVLGTIQSLLQLAQTLLLPFWLMGYTYACLRITRDEHTTPGSLLQGFRHFGPVLRLTLLEGLLYCAVIFLASNLSAMIFTMLPQGKDLMVLVSSPVTDEAAMEAILAATRPMILIALPLSLLLLLPIFYRLRMAEFCLLDAPERGALAAMIESGRMMKGNRLSLFKLDLSFWWFFGLDLLVALAAYGDALLPMVGISLPWNEQVSYYVFYGLYIICQLALYWWRKNEVSITYAHVYEALRQSQEPDQATIDA